MNRLYRSIARGLTLGRFAATPLFLYMLIGTSEEPPGDRGAILLLIFLGIAGSDLLDGFFARLAGASSHRWGRLDALADILFTSSSLLVAAFLNLIGIWVPLGIIVLAVRFMHRNRPSDTTERVRLSEDRPGKAVGVLSYLLVGVVVSGIWLQTDVARMAVWWLGNLVFAYTVAVVLSRNLRAK